MPDTSRIIEQEIALDAPADRVWRALTDAEELMRWFPLQAEVVPGAGGRMIWKWRGDEWAWATGIEVWKPGRRLRLVQDGERPHDAEGRYLEEGAAAPARIMIEFTLGSQGGRTRLRLVHSGFGEGAAWDDELDGIRAGWRSELCILEHYLRWHPGRNRHVAWARATTDLSRKAAWDRLLGPDGYRLEAGRMVVGAPYTATAHGTAVSGTLQLHLPGADMVGTAREFGNGLFRLSIYPAAGRVGATVYLASWGGDGAAVAAFERRAQEFLDRLFA